MRSTPNPATRPIARRFQGLVLCWTAIVGCLSPKVARAAEPTPLHVRVDALIRADRLAPVPARSDDAEFLRRVYLDLHGLIPTAEQTRRFLDDRAADKRAKLVDALLAEPRFARHMADVFDVAWGERRPEKVIKAADWYAYLHQSFLDGKPYDQLVREVLTADDVDAKLKPAAKFFHDRECEPNTMTRDIGRFFFGMDLQCSQCHDHPVIDDYSIGDYYGLYAFVGRTYLHQDKKSKTKVIAEKAEGEANYKSVFTGESADKVQPRLPRGTALVEPTFAKGEEYRTKPTADVKPEPKFSRRAKLAELATDGSNEMFNRNAVNRLWAHLFGRGLVHPVDFMHPANPASHPAVLDLLAREFREHRFDVRWLLRELVLTEAYQRTSVAPPRTALPAGVAAARLPKWESEQARLAPLVEKAAEQSKRAALAFAEATGRATSKPAAAAEATKTDPRQKADPKQKPDAKEKAAAKPSTPPPPAAADLARLQTQAEAAAAEVRRLQAELTAVERKLEEARQVVEFEKLAAGDPKGADRAWEALVRRWTDQGDLATLKPLTPEAFTMSLLQATGLVAAAQAKPLSVLKKSPPKEIAAAPPAERERLSALFVDKQTFEPLRSNINRFVDLYAGEPGADFAATLNQALFFGNGGVIDGWIRPTGSNLTARLAKLSDDAVADEMYLAAFSRLPTSDERTAVVAYLKDRGSDRAVALQEMVWGLLAGNEFRFNH